MKLSVHCSFFIKKYGYEKTFSMLKEAGFDAIDFTIGDWVSTDEDIKNCPAYHMSDEELVAHYTSVYEAARAAGIEIAQTHAIYGPAATINHPQLFKETTERSIWATEILHCKHIVVHPVALPDRIYDRGYEECFRFNLEFFRSFLPALKKHGVKLAIEPMWTSDKETGAIAPTVASHPDEILHYLRELGTEHYCSCPDIGHFALVAKDTGVSVGDALRRLGASVEILHVHEVDGTRDNHTAPFTIKGITDWDDVMQALAEIGYKGVLNFEVGASYSAAYPDELHPEAMRHFAVIGRYLANKFEAARK